MCLTTAERPIASKPYNKTVKTIYHIRKEKHSLIKNSDVGKQNTIFVKDISARIDYTGSRNTSGWDNGFEVTMHSESRVVTDWRSGYAQTNSTENRWATYLSFKTLIRKGAWRSPLFKWSVRKRNVTKIKTIVIIILYFHNSVQFNSMQFLIITIIINMELNLNYWLFLPFSISLWRCQWCSRCSQMLASK